MTIIKPNHYFKISLTFLFFVFALAALVVLNIYFYHQIVDLKFSLKEQSKNIKQLQVINAELKNNLYQLIDVDNLKKIASNELLVIDNQPDYLRINSLEDHLVRQ